VLTESGREEFVFVVKGKQVLTLMRDDGLTHHYSLIARREAHFTEQGFKVVKVYGSDDANDFSITAVDCEIGYHEQRLTALERLAVRCYAGKYWDIPF